MQKWAFIGRSLNRAHWGDRDHFWVQEPNSLEIKWMKGHLGNPISIQRSVAIVIYLANSCFVFYLLIEDQLSVLDEMSCCWLQWPVNGWWGWGQSTLFSFAFVQKDRLWTREWPLSCDTSPGIQKCAINICLLTSQFLKTFNWTDVIYQRFDIDPTLMQYRIVISKARWRSRILPGPC